MKHKHNVGYFIRKLRESKDLSQENIAGELNITTSAYSKIERGVTDPSVGRLLRIAEVLETDVTDFFKGVPRQTAREDGINQQYGFATKSDIEELMHLIDGLKRDLERLKTTATPAKAQKKVVKKVVRKRRK